MASKARNLQLLSNTLGITLELEAQEKNVGPFYADLLCKDVSTDNWVVIENQIERTDHGHLGQLITYAAGPTETTACINRFDLTHRAKVFAGDRLLTVPTLADYERLAPFDLAELVEAANAVMRTRPRLAVSARTVRYYISKGILHAPQGSPKFARYGMDHLARLVGARSMVDTGTTLELAKSELDLILAQPDAPVAIQALVDSGGDKPTAESKQFVREERHAYSIAGPALTIRVPLGDNSFLEVSSSGRLEDRLAKAREAVLAIDPVEVAKTIRQSF